LRVSPPLRIHPIVDILSDLIFRDAITLLNFSLELIATPSDLVQIIIGKIPLFLFHPAFDLLPISFHSIPVHRIPPGDI